MTHKKFPRVRRGVYDLSLEGPDRRRSGGRRGERGKLGQILAKFASPQNPKGNLWQLLSTTQYDLAPGSCVKSTRAYNSRICPRFCPCPVSGKVSTRSEGILCMARVKGRRASSNHLGCSLREPNEAKHAKLIFNNNILSIVWKTDV